MNFKSHILWFRPLWGSLILAVIMAGLASPCHGDDEQFKNLRNLLRQLNNLPEGEQELAANIIGQSGLLGRNTALEFFKIATDDSVNIFAKSLGENLTEQELAALVRYYDKSNVAVIKILEERLSQIESDPAAASRLRNDLSRLQQSMRSRQLTIPFPQRCLAAWSISATMGATAFYIEFGYGESDRDIETVKGVRTAILGSSMTLLAAACMADIVFRRDAMKEYVKQWGESTSDANKAGQILTIIQQLQGNDKLRTKFLEALGRETIRYERTKVLQNVSDYLKSAVAKRENANSLLGRWRAYLTTSRGLSQINKLSESLTESERNFLFGSLTEEQLLQLKITPINRKLMNFEIELARDFTSWLESGPANRYAPLYRELVLSEQKAKQVRLTSGQMTNMSYLCFWSMGTALSMYGTKLLVDKTKQPLGTTMEYLLENYGNTIVQGAALTFAGVCGLKYIRGWTKEDAEQLALEKMTASDWQRIRLIAERVAELRELNPSTKEEDSLSLDSRSAKEVVDNATEVYVRYLEETAGKPHPLQCSAVFLKRLLLEPFR